VSAGADWISLAAYARLYGVHRNTVHKWLEAGLLVTYRVGHVIRVKDAPPLHSTPKGQFQQKPRQ
jgi:hypothetical protein